jgi:hypothetical protein
MHLEIAANLWQFTPSLSKARGSKVFFFETKRSKKRLVVLAAVFPEKLSPDSQRFFAAFFQKRSPS